MCEPGYDMGGLTTRYAVTDENLVRVGRQVAARRGEMGYTQREFAETAGVALNTYALCERGRSFPHVSTQRKLERALQWPAGTLDALRRGEPVPQDTEPSRPAVPDTGATVQTLSIARAVAVLASQCRQILLGPQPYDAQRVQRLLGELDGQVLALEAVLASSLPHAADSTFSQTIGALTDLRQIRVTR